MLPLNAERVRLSEDFAASLTEAVLPVAQRHGVEDASITVELDLWHALSEVLQASGPQRRNLTAALADAAYRVLLPRHPHSAFVDLELDVWKAVRAAS